MRSLLIVLALGVAALAVPFRFDHDIRINVYDVFKSLYAAAPLSAYLNQVAQNGFFRFQEDFFHYYPEEEIREVLVVYRPNGADYLHGYYVRAEDVSNYDDAFFNAVHPIYEYLNSGEYHAFTPYAARQVAPQFFNQPLREVFYQYYHDVDINRDIPVVFLVPRSEVQQSAVDDLILIAEYEVTRNGSHDIHEYFDNIARNLKRRDVVYPSPYYRTAAYAYPYNYYSSYASGYPYYYGYPSYLRNNYYYPSHYLVK